MKMSRFVLTVALSLLGTVTGIRADRGFVYSEVVVPGAVFANAQGINAGGDIVGVYRDAFGKTHGYLWRRGEVTTIDYPNAAITEARGIGASGEIVGSYRLPGEPAVNVHGFLLTKDGTFVNVDYPGHINTIPQRILPDGTVLGCRHDTDTMGTMNGIVMTPAGVNTETDAFASMHNGATPDLSLVAGLFTNMMTGRVEGYVIEDGVFTEFVVPGSRQTAAWDVNPRGEIVGVYADMNGRIHGFVRDGDSYQTIDVPEATITRVFGINAGGDVVGAYVDAAGTHAFVGSRTRRNQP